MRIRSARFCNFRNAELAQADLDAASVWVFGKNAQGKTNLLEGLGLLGAVRSFRTSKTSNLIRHGQLQAQALFEIFHESLGDCNVMFEISPNSRKVFVDGQEQKRLGEFIGRFPITVLSSDDIKLVRGAPLERRKFMDVLISSLDPEYFDSLKSFHAALAQRNALLKNQALEAHAFYAFETEMARHAVVVSQKRKAYLFEMAEIAGQKYGILSEGRELAAVRLKPALNFESADSYKEILERERKKDCIFGSTSSGPHRDDFSLTIGQKNVKDFASEGQQRSIVLSLKLAQFELLKAKRNLLPVLLCDDILGELDETRRAAFWNAADPAAQVIATSTAELPEYSSGRSNWKCIKVENGRFFSV